jgi:uncharacterized protein DUF1707/2TM domain-containing protein
MSDSDRLRASDADREHAADHLREHFSEGRLSSEEFSDRLDSVYAATTLGELARLREDLPSPPAPVVKAPDPHRGFARQRLYQESGLALIAVVACVAIWAASGAQGSFWPVWVMLACGVRLAQDGWRMLGPAGNPELAGERHERKRVAREAELAKLDRHERRRVAREDRRDRRRELRR